MVISGNKKKKKEKKEKKDTDTSKRLVGNYVLRSCQPKQGHLWEQEKKKKKKKKDTWHIKEVSW